MKYLVSKRPVVAGFSITVNFMYYKSGIFNDPACTKDIDHAVVISNSFGRKFRVSNEI